jgi:hypothetical protein
MKRAHYEAKPGAGAKEVCAGTEKRCDILRLC